MKTFNQFNEDANKNAALFKSLFGSGINDFESQMKNITNNSNLPNTAPKIINKLSGMADKFKMTPKQQQNFGQNLSREVGQRMNLPDKVNKITNKVDSSFNKINEKLPGMIDKFGKMSQPGGKIDVGLKKINTMINMLSQ